MLKPQEISRKQVEAVIRELQSAGITDQTTEVLPSNLIDGNEALEIAKRICAIDYGHDQCKFIFKKIADRKMESVSAGLLISSVKNYAQKEFCYDIMLSVSDPENFLKEAKLALEHDLLDYEAVEKRFNTLIRSKVIVLPSVTETSIKSFNKRNMTILLYSFMLGILPGVLIGMLFL